MAKKPTKRQSKKEYTLAEFKAWLEGIEELQPEEWAPSVEQWRTIREKLLNIIEEAPVAPRPAAIPPAPPAGPVYREPPMMPPPMMPPPMPVMQSGPSALDEANVEITPAAAAALKGNLPKNMAPGPDGRLKTPNVDTSDGNFNSSFE